MEIPGQFIPGTGAQSPGAERTASAESITEPPVDQGAAVQQPFVAVLASLVADQGSKIILPDLHLVPRGQESAIGEVVAITAGMAQPVSPGQGIPPASGGGSEFISGIPMPQQNTFSPSMSFVMATDQRPQSFNAGGQGVIAVPPSSRSKEFTGQESLPGQPALQGTAPGQASIQTPAPDPGSVRIAGRSNEGLTLTALRSESQQRAESISPEVSNRPDSGVPPSFARQITRLESTRIPVHAPTGVPPGPRENQLSESSAAIPGNTDRPSGVRGRSEAHPEKDAAGTTIVNMPSLAREDEMFVTGKPHTIADILRSTGQRAPSVPGETSLENNEKLPGDILMHVLDAIPATKSREATESQTSGKTMTKPPVDRGVPEPVNRIAQSSSGNVVIEKVEITASIKELPTAGKMPVQQEGRTGQSTSVEKLLAQVPAMPPTGSNGNEAPSTRGIPSSLSSVRDSARQGIQATSAISGNDLLAPEERTTPSEKKSKRISGSTPSAEEAETRQNTAEQRIERRHEPVKVDHKEQPHLPQEGSPRKGGVQMDAGDQSQTADVRPSVPGDARNAGKNVHSVSDGGAEKKVSGAVPSGPEKLSSRGTGIQAHLQTPATIRPSREAVAGRIPSREATVVLDQIVKAMRMEVGERSSGMRLVLEPASLGEVLINVSVEHGSVTAKFDVVNPETKAIIESNLPQLQQALASRGLVVDRIDVASAQSFLQREAQDGRTSRGKEDSRRGADVAEETGDRSSRFLGYNTLEVTL